jgi:hypothetical protein
VARRADEAVLRGERLPHGLAQLDAGVPIASSPALYARAVWGHPGGALVLTAVLSALYALPSLLLLLFPRRLDTYTRARWASERRTIDGDYAKAIARSNALLAWWSPGVRPAVPHFADPPYNTRPLLFGIETAAVKRLLVPGAVWVNGMAAESSTSAAVGDDDEPANLNRPARADADPPASDG